MGKAELDSYTVAQGVAALERNLWRAPDPSEASREIWESERKRGRANIGDSGGSVLSTEHLRKHLKLQVPVEDWEKKLSDSVDDWRSSIPGPEA